MEWKCDAAAAVGSVMLESDAVEADLKWWLYWTIDYCCSMNSSPRNVLNFEYEMNRCSVGVNKMKRD